MRHTLFVAAAILVAPVPALAQASQAHAPAAAPAAGVSRQGSWELSIGGGATYLDKQIVDVIALTSATQRLVPGAALRLGLNLGRSWNLSAGTFAGYTKPATVLQPFGALSWTTNINASASPFLTVGGGVTSVSWKTTASYSFRSQYTLHAGLGLRLMLGGRTALRAEVREQYEKYSDTSVFSRAAYYPTATLGLSFFFGGHAAPAPAPAPPPAVAEAPAPEAAAPAPAPEPVAQAAMTLAIAPAVDTLTALGRSRQLSVTAQDANNNAIATPEVTWTSSDASVATVSEGVVTAVKNGSATITASAGGGASATSAVVVRQTVATVSLMPPGATLSAAGGTFRFTVLANDANGRPVSGKVITWADSAPSVATVGPGGVVTAVANGTTKISATVEGVTGSALVTVTLPATPAAPAAAAAPAPGAFVLPGVGETVVLRTVNFRPNSARLPPDALAELGDVAQAMVAIPNARWEIGGYTSDMGDAARNQTLSRRRAQAVRTYLVRQGVPASRLTAVGYGSQNPIASNATAAGRRRNMRVEVRRLR